MSSDLKNTRTSEGTAGVWEEEEEEEATPTAQLSTLAITDSPFCEADFKGSTLYWTTVTCNATSAAADIDRRKIDHALGIRGTCDPPEACNLSRPFVGLSRYNEHQFMGILVDTGAADYSTCGLPQFKAFKKLRSSLTIDTSTEGHITITFGPDNKWTSLGSAVVDTPIGPVSFHVLLTDTPFLLSLEDMDTFKEQCPQRHGVTTRRMPGNPSLRFFSSGELTRLHRRLGHPSVDRLYRLLRAAGHDNVEHKELQGIRDFCVSCAYHQGPPRRFKFNLKEEQDAVFNGTIIVDVAYIDKQPYIHVVDEATSFTAARWLDNLPAQRTWDRLRECWIDTCIGPPDCIVHDQGTNFVAKEFRDNAALMGSKVKPVPTEAHHSVRKIERYHGVLERAFKIICREIPELNRESALQMTVKAVNDIAGPNGIVPTLLVFDRSEELEKARASRTITEALRMRNGPIPVRPALNDWVLVYRDSANKKGWEGPYRVRGVNDEDITVDFGNGIEGTFRSTSVRAFNHDVAPISVPAESATQQPSASAPAQVTDPHVVTNVQPPVRRGRGRPRKAPMTAYAELAGDIATLWLTDCPPLPSYEHSRRTEINGLLEKNVFEPYERALIEPGTRVFNGRFVDEVKHAGTAQAMEKSRFVVQAHNDKGKTSVLTQSPTIQRVSQRLLLSIAACRMAQGDIRLLLRDISQAYVQSTTELQRNFFVNPHADARRLLGLPDDMVLRVVRPLYGVPEAGNHWFATYTAHHMQKLGMSASTYDACLLIRKDTMFGLVALQTDDTLILADKDFAELEKSAIVDAGFLAKEREELTPTTPVKFNGGVLQLSADGVISLSQESQVVNIDLVSDTPKVNRGTRGKMSKPGRC